jgi:hypothetical protein
MQNYIYQIGDLVASSDTDPDGPLWICFGFWKHNEHEAMVPNTLKLWNVVEQRWQWGTLDAHIKLT